jgi:hypothetical protein
MGRYLELLGNFAVAEDLQLVEAPFNEIRLDE